MACIVSGLVFVLWLLCLQRTVSKTTLAGQDSVNTASHETDKLMDVSLFEFLSHSFLRQSWSQLCMVSFLANSSYLDILKQVKGWILKWNKKKLKKHCYQRPDTHFEVLQWQYPLTLQLAPPTSHSWLQVVLCMKTYPRALPQECWEFSISCVWVHCAALPLGFRCSVIMCFVLKSVPHTCQLKRQGGSCRMRCCSAAL